ncbi:MAG: beta-ketoacyl-ACP synthase II [Erythrobacter sp.]|nr:beta-ketoacyl-ACP synthase II [Erythrobacter sp.]
MRRRVVVTGIGCVTPIGNSVPTMWKSLQECQSGIGPITHFDASGFPTTFAAEVKGFDLGQHIPNPERFEFAGRNIHFAIGAAAEAVKDAGILDDNVDPAMFGVYLGAGEGQQDFQLFMKIIAESAANGEFDIAEFTRRGLEQMNPRVEMEQEPNMPAGHLASLFNAQGPNLNCLTACAASSQAIGEATEIIRLGEADVMLSGGAHSMIHPFGVTGFNLLTALSTNNEAPQRASRPFDLNRDGFVLGEGAGMLILEELEHARKRGARIYGEVLGYGSTADAYRITDIHPEGRGATACINMALKDAGVNREEIGYVNAHGTSTMADTIELAAVKRVLGDDLGGASMSSTKSAIGHLLGGAGAVESIFCILAIRDQVVPPTLNLTNPDEGTEGVDLVPLKAKQREVRAVLNNSFGFGGTNASLVMKKVD